LEKSSKKIPFDALTLAAVCAQINEFRGGKVQGVRQPTDDTVVIELYAKGKTGHLLLCCHADYFRAHFVAKRTPTMPEPPAFCMALRARLDGAVLEQVMMKASDRVLVMTFNDGTRLIAELMGKHSNLFLLDDENKVAGAAKWVGSSKTQRPITPGVRYTWPPVMGSGIDLVEFDKPPKVHAKFPTEATAWEPGFAAGIGAYPISLAGQIPSWLPRDTISIALENHYETFVRDSQLLQLRITISNQLEKVLGAREMALRDLKETLAQGGKAPMWLRYGELILAYTSPNALSEEVLDTQDYDGTPMTIRLNPELSNKDNAQAYFTKAKKAKGRMGMVGEQIERISLDRDAVEGFLFKVLEATTLAQLENLRDEIKKRRWLNEQVASKDGRAERAWDGHRIREFFAPGGYRVLLGENATSNDYLTLRVAKGNDWWLHVRGGTSAHVIIQTQGQPDRVQRETLMFAAQLAVKHSPMKHSGYVSVDYTLKKYVRRPKGAAVGMASYTNEKTLSVDGI
jgi:predicted ribosome quality control (RQC) complex YloA/Tae2 family protein